MFIKLLSRRLFPRSGRFLFHYLNSEPIGSGGEASRFGALARLNARVNARDYTMKSLLPRSASSLACQAEAGRFAPTAYGFTLTLAENTLHEGISLLLKSFTFHAAYGTLTTSTTWLPAPMRSGRSEMHFW